MSTRTFVSNSPVRFDDAKNDLSRLIRTERPHHPHAGLISTISQRLEQDTAWLGMLAYASALPIAAVVGFVLYGGLF